MHAVTPSVTRASCPPFCGQDARVTNGDIFRIITALDFNAYRSRFMPQVPHTARPYVLNEATFTQVRTLKPNVAVQPWGATEAHNFHLPHGTDCIQASAIAETAVAAANAKGARCILLPCVPYGNDNLQLS